MFMYEPISNTGFFIFISRFFLSCETKKHSRLYLSVLACIIKPSNILTCNLEQMDVLYQEPLFNQSWWLLLSISYFISSLDQIIHDLPTWCNLAFNTNLVIIYSDVKVFKYKHVYFLKLILLIAMDSNLSLSPIKHNSNMSNTLNNEVILPLFGFIIFAVCSIMVRKRNHLIVSFIVVGQIPNCFPILFTWNIILILQWVTDIGGHGFSDWYYPTGWL